MRTWEIKKEKITNDFFFEDYNSLVDCEKLGFYNCCEMTTIFLYDKKDRSCYNFYTIFSFEERVVVREKTKYLFDELKKINERFSFGIIQKVLKEEDIKELFLKISNCSNVVNLGDGDLKVGVFEKVPKTFVEQDSTKIINLNKVLKNNFKNGSYILEFFDTEKRINRLLKKDDLKKITQEIFKIIPIDLFTISDRIGNIIFQFPSLNISCSYSQDEEEQFLYYNVKVDERIKSNINYLLESELMRDNVIVGFSCSEIKKHISNIEFRLGDTSPSCCTKIMDLDSGIILARQESSFMRSVKMKLSIGTQYPEMRENFDSSGKRIEELEIQSFEKIDIGGSIKREREDIIESRKYGKRIEELYQSQDFKQYGLKLKREAAINDIINLMNRAEGESLYIWDPYLTVEDLLETVYRTVVHMKVYALTSKKAINGQKISEWIESQKSIIEKRSNHYGMNLEMRCQWGKYGYQFHDRFIIINKRDEEAEAWSIGASLNSVGKNHHIIQKVENPQVLADTFEELWKELQSEECLVWKVGR